MPVDHPSHPKELTELLEMTNMHQRIFYHLWQVKDEYTASTDEFSLIKFV